MPLSIARLSLFSKHSNAPTRFFLYVFDISYDVSFHDRLKKNLRFATFIIYLFNFTTQSRNFHFRKFVTTKRIILTRIISFALIEMYVSILPFEFPLTFLFLFPFPLSFDSTRSSLSPIARLRPTIGVPMPTLSETLRTGPYPPPPRYPRQVLQRPPQHRSGMREIEE